jgi:hypothetical protein
MRHIERHRTARIGWLRAAVLGANDCIVSTASLIVGVAAASASQSSLLLTGVAGLVAGARWVGSTDGIWRPANRSTPCRWVALQGPFQNQLVQFVLFA